MKPYVFPARQSVGFWSLIVIAVWGVGWWILRSAIALSDLTLGLFWYGWVLSLATAVLILLAFVVIGWSYWRLKYEISEQGVAIVLPWLRVSFPLIGVSLSQPERLREPLSEDSPDWARWAVVPRVNRWLILSWGEQSIRIAPRRQREFRALFFRLENLLTADQAEDEQAPTTRPEVPPEVQLRWPGLWRSRLVQRPHLRWLVLVNLFVSLLVGTAFFFVLERLPFYTVLSYRVATGISWMGPRDNLLMVWGGVSLLGLLLTVAGVIIHRRERFAAQLLLMAYPAIALLSMVYLGSLWAFVE